jgi:hypothetical protein
MSDLHFYILSFWLKGTDPPYYISCFLVRGDRNMPTPLITSHVFWWGRLAYAGTPSLHLMFFSWGGVGIYQTPFITSHVF